MVSSIKHIHRRSSPHKLTSPGRQPPGAENRAVPPLHFPKELQAKEITFTFTARKKHAVKMSSAAFAQNKCVTKAIEFGGTTTKTL